METKHKKENAGKANGDMLGDSKHASKQNDILVFLPRNLIWGCHGEL